MRISVLGYIDDPSQNSIRIAQAWTLQRHNVQLLALSTSNVVEKVLKHEPEFCLVTMGRDFDHSILTELRDKGIFLVQWIPDEYGPGDQPGGMWFENIKGIYNLLMCETRGIVPLLKDYADEVIWIPMYFDQRFHKCTEKRGQHPFNIGFLGGANTTQSSIRQKFLNQLIKDGYDLQISGGYFNHDYGNLQKRIHNSKFFSDGILVGIEMVKFYSRAKIGLNFINDKLSQYDLGISNRAFKTIGSGCFLLTQEIEGLETLLIPGEHCITYSPMDYHDLTHKIDFFLKDERQRERIALQGQQHILKNYNIDIVTSLFIDEIKKRL